MKLYYALVISLILHILLYQNAHWLQMSFNQKAEEEVIEITFKENERKVIKQLDAPDQIPPDDSPTPFLSKNKRRYRKQQIARNRGEAVNRSQTQNRQQRQQTRKTEQQEQISDKNKQELIQKLAEIQRLSDQVISQLTREQSQRGKPRRRQRQQQGQTLDASPFQQSYQPSTFYDPRTKAPLGGFTALNTDRFTYYSYFSRVERRVGPLIQQQITRIIQNRPNVHFGDQDKEIWTSHITITLDKEGHFVRGDVFKKSGVDKFEYAFLDSFRAGAPIPNPPEGMIDEDGLIRLQYAFNVFWRPGYYNRPAKN